MTTPLWLYGGERPPSEDFLSDPRRNCIKWKGVAWLFFSDDLVEQQMAKRLCATCPLFRACTRWSLAHDRELEYGIFAMMTADRRHRIAEGREKYADPRRDFNFAQNAAKAAARKRARQGVHKRRLPEEEL